MAACSVCLPPMGARDVRTAVRHSAGRPSATRGEPAGRAGPGRTTYSKPNSRQRLFVCFGARAPKGGSHVEHSSNDQHGRRQRRLGGQRDETAIASDKVEGTAVYDRQGNSLGSIHNVMIDKFPGRSPTQ